MWKREQALNMKAQLLSDPTLHYLGLLSIPTLPPCYKLDIYSGRVLQGRSNCGLKV